MSSSIDYITKRGVCVECGSEKELTIIREQDSDGNITNDCNDYCDYCGSKFEED